MTIKVVFCWSDISGYMAACWLALHKLPEVDVFVVAFQARTETAFSDQLMQGIPCRLLDIQERQDTNLIKRLVLAESPDVLVLCGWLHKPYRQLAFTSEFHETGLIMTMDTPWWGTWKQHLASWFLRSYLQRINSVVVAGERSWQYASRLGIQPANIARGVYGIDYDAWSPLWEKRIQSEWPRSFLFVGRYVPIKGVDVLVKAYQIYRSQVSHPWNLVCCGQGALESKLEGQPGIENRGFLQPTEMSQVWQSAGAFILPSRFDPWPLALIEAAAAGLPIICTDTCGSAVEVIRPWYNGLIIPQEDPTALAQAMLTLHQEYAELSIWGKRSQQLAAPYAANIWVRRWQQIIHNTYQANTVKKNPSKLVNEQLN
ncbi:glycosyltransferase family 4 protein [Nostoc parmelioides]|uniref:Glycosyltransferase family 4 protein n=1 Tax=Nostoc parmelioides FACHB-3921 TaxID=2692909 RepID=A0ABR8BKV7_9NOSO|nr:glycosyltransferase family 4 protein [Nostoc parmelioides]MBD2254506.1 glycosyltransferase family 4 protein [Nostoc parmelioides FACHB-3921]